MLPFAPGATEGGHSSLTFLALLVGLALITIIMVGVGDRLKLPYPVLMVIATVAIAFIPGFPYFEIQPELILPLFLPPLLYAAAMKTSWSVFKIRWRSIILLAVTLVFLTVAIVAGAMWLLIPSIAIPAAIALGAMVSPPDPVAVESVAGRVHMPRRLIMVLQSEGLFNDAAAIVIFQAAVAATVSGQEVDGGVVLKFLVGAVLAVIIGLLMGLLTKGIHHITDSPVARSAVTLVVPFAVYLIAEHFHASGVIAVVVTALEIRRNSRPHDAEERITSKSFWEVLELLITGIAFGLIGLEIKHIILVEGTDIYRMIIPALIICAIVILVRVTWLSVLIVPNRMRKDNLPPTGFRDVLVLTWSGMRGLPTLALALALPTTLADGSPFPHRDLILVTACAVLIFTLVIPGLTLPWLMRVLGMKESPAAEKEAEAVLAQRGQEAAMAQLENSPVLEALTPEQMRLVKERLSHLRWDLSHDEVDSEHPFHKLDQREIMTMAQTIALDAAREELLLARREIDVDPEVADKVIRKLDMRTLLIED